jgi:hypothetical protein
VRALCGHTVDTAAARALAELGEIDPDCYCDPCTRIHQGAAGRALDQDWRKEPLAAEAAPGQEIDPGPWQGVGASRLPQMRDASSRGSLEG